MNVLTFNRGITPDGNTLTLTDATTVYGVDLGLRSTLALVAYITFVPTGGTPQVIAPLAYDPSDVVTYNVNVDGKDGVYYVLIFALPEYTSGVLTEGDVVYDMNEVSSNPLAHVKRWTSGALVAVTDFAALATEPEVSYGAADSLIRVELTKRKDLLQLLVLQKLEALSLKKCEHGEYAEAQRNFNYVRALWVGSYIQYCSGNKATAQRYIETGNDLGLKILKV